MFRLIHIIIITTLASTLNGQKIHFTNYSERLKFVQGTMGQAKCGADMNGDGLDDLTRVSKRGIYIDFQNRDGSFNQQFFKQEIEVLPIWSIAAGDLNQDGYNDMVFGGNNKVSFLIFNPIENRYIEQVMPESIKCQRSNFIDIDEDGDLDVFICNDSGKSNAYKNEGNGLMTLDNMLINTKPLAGNYSSIWVDYNNDGHTDLYISKCLAETLPGDPRRTNLLYKNNGDKTFTEVGEIAGIDDNAQSWSTVFEDFNNDGDFDAFVVNHDQQNRLFKNNGNGTFTNVILNSGIDPFDFGAFENLAGDINNDGFIDLISDLNHQLYLGNGDLTFTGHKLPFDPEALGDFNNDGFLDATHRNELWLNDGNNNHGVKLNLVGVESNNNGIGARVELYGSWGKQIRELRSGQGYRPMQSLQLHFGLGQQSTIDSILIKWPSGIFTALKNLNADTTYSIVEASCSLNKFRLMANDSLTICPNQSQQIQGPVGYVKYRWSDGSSTESLNVDKARNYFLVFEDSLGCRGITNTIKVLEADKNIPVIEIVETDYPKCLGNKIVLKSQDNSKIDWSEGSKNTEKIEVTNSGVFYCSKDSTCGDGKIFSLPKEILFFKSEKPEINEIKYFSNDSIVVNLKGDSCLWYNKFGVLVHKGCEKKLYYLKNDSTFYVYNETTFESNPISAGKLDTNGFSTNFMLPRQLYFTSKKSFVINTVDIFIKNKTNEGIRSIFLMNHNDQKHDSINVDLKTGKNTVKLNFQIEPGTYKLTCDRADQLMNVGPLDYPYPLSDFGQIDSSSVSLNFYPYFFNWQISAPPKKCLSDGLVLNLSPSQTDAVYTPSLKIFPNPCSKEFHLTEHTSENTILHMYNLEGKLVQSQTYTSEKKITMNVENIETGYYFLKVITNKKVQLFSLCISN
jgi:hypothetical protein